uniref:Cytochrome P450 n=1 Tax=Heterorhabditis bacteriophora TaxID=37862 RepID=A0A1I7W998_HETBA
MAILVPFFLIFIFTAATIYVMKHLMLRDKLKSINQPRSYPIIGHGLITKPDAEGFINQVMGMGYLYPDSPRMVLFWLGPVPALMLYSAQLVEPILTSSKHLNKGFAYDLLEPWLGRSILTSFFLFYLELIFKYLVFITHLSFLLRGITSEPVDIISLVTLCTLDIICETSMGRCVDAQLKKDNDYVWAVHTINDCIQQRMKNPLMWNDFIYNTRLYIIYFYNLKLIKIYIYIYIYIVESLRLYPSVPIIMRKLGCDQKLGGIVVPEGTHILLNQYMVHRDPNHWIDPDKFDPDRQISSGKLSRSPPIRICALFCWESKLHRTTIRSDGREGFSSLDITPFQY